MLEYANDEVNGVVKTKISRIGYLFKKFCNGGGDLASDPLCSLSSHSKTIIHKYPNNIDQIFLPMSKSRNSEAKKWKVYYSHFVAQKGIILMNLRKGGIVR